MNQNLKSALYRVNRAVDNDLAENSIMQTITIAVSAILIAAGLVTAPGLINNARDNNATGDLANAAYSQAVFESQTGALANYDNHPSSTYRLLENPGEGYAKFIPSGYKNDGGGRLLVVTEGDQWTAFSKSSSDKIFMRTSETAAYELVDDELLNDLGITGFSVLAGKVPTQYFAGMALPVGFTTAVVTDMYAAVFNNTPYDFSRGGTITPPAGEGTPSTPVDNGGGSNPQAGVCDSTQTSPAYTDFIFTTSSTTSLCDSGGNLLIAYGAELDTNGYVTDVILDNPAGTSLSGIMVPEATTITSTFTQSVTFHDDDDWFDTVQFSGATLRNQTTDSVIPSTCTPGSTADLSDGESVVIECSATFAVNAGDIISAGWLSPYTRDGAGDQFGNPWNNVAPGFTIVGPPPANGGSGK